MRDSVIQYIKDLESLRPPCPFKALLCNASNIEDKDRFYQEVMDKYPSHDLVSIWTDPFVEPRQND